MGIDSLQFLQATSPQYGNYQRAAVGERNQYQPQLSAPKYQYKELSAEDYERALAYVNGNNVSGANFFKTGAAKQVSNPKGAAFEGFRAPQANGTGELIPDVSNREDSIPECKWEAYMA